MKHIRTPAVESTGMGSIRFAPWSLYWEDPGYKPTVFTAEQRRIFDAQRAEALTEAGRWRALQKERDIYRVALLKSECERDVLEMRIKEMERLATEILEGETK